MPGNAAPMATARAVFTAPAMSPLTPAINSASEADTLRVRLLSMAQHKQAIETRAVPAALDCAIASDGQPNATPPATMASIPKTMRRSAFSLNTTHAMTAVSTASRFNKSDAVDPLVDSNPNISATGPRTPPKKIAPRSHGHSFLGRPEGFRPPSRARRARVKPNPLPR